MTTSKGPSQGAIFLTIFLDLVGFGIVMPFLALEAREAFGISEGTATLLGASYSLAQFLFVPLWGGLSDRIGRRPVLLISVAFSALSMAALGIALAYAEHVAWVFAARIFAGIATANIGTASAYIADITSVEDRVKGMGLIGMAFGLGFIVGPGLGGFLAEFPVGGRHGPMACFAAGFLSLVNLIWVYFGVKESLSPQSKPRKRRLLDGEAFVRVFSHPFLGRAVLANFLIILAFSGLEMTYAFYAKDQFQLDMGGVGGLFVFMGVVAALVQGGFMRRAGKRFQDSHLALAGLFLQIVAFAGMVAAPSFGYAGLVVASGLLAVGNGLTQPSLSGFVSRRSSADVQGAHLSLFQSFSALARVFGPALGGFLYQALAPAAPFWAGAVLNGLGVIVAVKLLRSKLSRGEALA